MESALKKNKNVNLRFKDAEKALEDVMEILDPQYLEKKMKEVESQYKLLPNAINQTRLGIIYHEVALNSSFYAKNRYKGFAKRSYDLLNTPISSGGSNYYLKPFRDSYKASALALIGAETKNLLYIGKSFREFEKVVLEFSETLYLPEFLRGSVAEKIPWFFFSKRKYAEKDFLSIEKKYQVNPDFANNKIMSFVYLGLALQVKKKNLKKQCLAYLDRAIVLDPDSIAARKQAQELKVVLL